MDIKISELKLILEKLFSHLEESDTETIHLNDAYYWHIPVKELYDPYIKPIDLDIGQLSDDWQDLKKVANGEHDSTITDFLDLAAIFRAIGEQGLKFQR